MPIFTAILTMIVPAIAIAASSGEIAPGCKPPRVMIAVSTSVGEGLAEMTGEPGQSRNKAQKRECAYARHARSRPQSSQVEAAFDSDEQAAGERSRDAQRLPIPVAVQRSRSACQRR